MAEPEPNDGRLSTNQLAERYHVRPETVRRWRSKGQGPPYVVLSSRLVRYPLAAVEEWERQTLVSRAHQ
ncbi:MAG TPA: helix-turn-helix domain-containing protein [Actinomycetota bacterium]|jgi:predicted DNA-binding transcriptional regulator AlpA|nr:helix-turn-helix domain-containing protein [Actinomycetota bacterium]